MIEDSKHMAVQLITAYVSNNKLTPDEFLKLVGGTITAIGGWNEPPKIEHKPQLKLAPPQTAPPPRRFVPAIPIERSVTPDYIYSLENGKPYKTLRLHLHWLSMTAHEYRTK